MFAQELQFFSSSAGAPALLSLRWIRSVPLLISSAVPSNSRAMKDSPSARMYERPASAYSTGLAQLLMKAREEVAARHEREMLPNLHEENKPRDDIISHVT